MQSCALCSKEFEVLPEDLQFYDQVSPVLNGEKISLPSPSHCPECRRQRKLAWRNERTLYQRTCNLCKTGIISVHSPENSYPVYCNSCWRDSIWDPNSFGVEYDYSKSFFVQFKELYDRTPQRAMVNEDGITCENCAYCFDISFSRNCYFMFGTWKNEDCLYGNICEQSRFCVDSYDTRLGSELAYECTDSQHLYNCMFLQNSENCNDCRFGFDLKGCKDCFGCVGLRQKQYCIYNEQLTKEEYLQRLQSFGLSSRKKLSEIRETFLTFALQFPKHALNQQNCEQCKGDHLFNCKNVIGFVNSNCQDSKWVERSDAPVHSYDIVQSGNCQWSLEQITADNSYGVHFSMYCNHSKQLLYCSDCLSCESCLGCVSLRSKKYCIFNTQYSKEEYEKRAAEILKSMKQSGEFGEFFPVSLSPFGYNETNAGEFCPLTEEEVRSKGWKWRTKQPYTTGKETVSPALLPDALKDVSDAILKEILACTECGKNYKIIAQELDFYRKMNLPIPAFCADCRHKNRLARRTSFNLFNRNCAKCNVAISTSYPPDSPEIVYCDKCYFETVY